MYMKQPKGFAMPKNENKFCKLVKLLYSLKQAPKQWHEKFNFVVLSYAFQHNRVDRCIYTKFNDQYGLIICRYADDMSIISTNKKGIDETRRYLSSQLKMKDLSESYVLKCINIVGVLLLGNRTI